jgi:hypothetical protein
MNSGVLKFLEADGDLVVAARIFGHRSVKTTLGHYVPNALRIALFERQVRRHQNRLIVQAFSDHERLLEVSISRRLRTSTCSSRVARTRLLKLRFPAVCTRPLLLARD